MASNITAGLQSMLLIEHWYPGKYSVTCTLTVMPAMVARGTMLARPALHHLSAQKAMVTRFSPRGGTILRYGIHIASSRCVVPPFAEPWRAGDPVRRAPIQELPAPARCQSAQIRDPGARKKYLWPLGLRHVWGPLEHRGPIVAICRRPHPVIVEPGLIRHF